MPTPAPCSSAALLRRYDIKAPSMFNTRNVGKTLVTRTQGTKVRAGEAAKTSAVEVDARYQRPHGLAKLCLC